MMKNIYLVLGAVLVLVGIVGFVMPSPLFGLFEVNTLQNIIHLASGALTILAATQGLGAMRTWGRVFGLVYLAVGVIGFVMPDMFGLMHVNMPDNLLHLALAAVFLYTGFLAPPKP
jgi:preprotein translocase subunit Sss1